MTAPFVGLPTDGNGCAFSLDLDTPACGAPSATHIISETRGWGLVALASCDAHSNVARAAGVVIDEHPYRPGCPDDCWTATP